MATVSEMVRNHRFDYSREQMSQLHVRIDTKNVVIKLTADPSDISHWL
jgi:hypothetical protein